MSWSVQTGTTSTTWTNSAATLATSWSSVTLLDPYVTPREVSVVSTQAAGVADLIAFQFPLSDEFPGFRLAADRPVQISSLNSRP